MTIKQLGGVFGRNPTFNDVTIEGELTFDGDIDVNSDLTINGNLGVNVSNPSYRIHAKGGDGQSASMRLEATDADSDAFIVIDNDASGWSFGIDGDDYDQWILSNAFGLSNPKLKVKAGGDLTVSTGNLVIGTSGKGIDFSATSDGSGTATSELFDDYEEGTFTPAFSASGVTITHDVQVGRYVKIGNMVTVWINLGTDAVSGGPADLTITGLPYTTESGYSGGIALGLNYSFSSAVQVLRFAPSGTTVDLYQSNSATRQTSAILDTGTNDNRLQFTGSYRAA